MNHAKTAFSTEMCAGAITSVAQCLAPLQYTLCIVRLVAIQELQKFKQTYFRRVLGTIYLK
jgi:hypothetical protein